MKNKKNIERLREELLKAFSSTVQLSNENTLNTKTLEKDLQNPLPYPNEPSNIKSQSKDININVTIDGSNSKEEYKKDVTYNSKTNLYSINLKKNESVRPLNTILNTTNSITSVTPLFFSPTVNTVEKRFYSPQAITKKSLKNKTKTKTKEERIGYMSFINQEPYNFFTNTSTYHVSNFYPKTSEVYKNNISTLNSNPTTINTNKNESTILQNINNEKIISDGDVNQNISSDSTTTNINENNNNRFISNTSNYNDFSEANTRNVNQNVVNESNTRNVNQNVVNESNTRNVNQNNNNRFISNNQNSNVFMTSNDSNKTNIINNDNNKTQKSNETIIEHNRQQIFSPNYTFFNKELFYTIDPSNNESISEIKNMTFNQMKTRMVNKIQARTILNNKENKVLIPAFADGGMVNGPNLIIAGEKNPEMIVPVKPKNSTKTMKADSKTFLEGGNVTQKIDSYPNDANASKAIEKNMVLKTTPSTKEQLDIEELSSSDAIRYPKKSTALNTSQQFFDEKNSDQIIARTKQLKEGMVDFTLKNKNTFVDDIKQNPVWRTMHM